MGTELYASHLASGGQDNGRVSATNKAEFRSGNLGPLAIPSDEIRRSRLWVTGEPDLFLVIRQTHPLPTRIGVEICNAGGNLNGLSIRASASNTSLSHLNQLRSFGPTRFRNFPVVLDSLLFLLPSYATHFNRCLCLCQLSSEFSESLKYVDLTRRPDTERSRARSLP